MSDRELLVGQAIEFFNKNDFGSAERCLRDALALGEDAELSNNLGIVLKAQGRLPEAIEAYKRAVGLDATFPDARYNLGNAYRACRQLEEALDCFRAVVGANPKHGHATAALGQTLLALGRAEEAIRFLRQAVELNAADADLICDLGNALAASGQMDEAVRQYQRAVRLDPRNAQAWYYAGNAELSRKEWAIAALCFGKALEIAPGWHEAHHNLGQALFELGDTDAALEQFRQAQAGARPELPTAMIAVIIPGAPSADNEAVLEARRSFAKLLPTAATSQPGRTGKGERLRIGYLSSFFSQDNWMKPVWNLINRHNRERFEIHLFSTVPASQIEHGYRKHEEDRFHEIGGRTNQETAALIASCDIDLLVDLNGYSDLRQLPVFALRPARRIAGWFNLYATTGISAYDYLIGDAEVIPAEEEQFYTETILRVPGSYLSFDVNYPVPDVQPPPFMSSGRISFGCLAPQYKINPVVVSAWCRILSQVPGSELLLKSRALQSTHNRQFVLKMFEGHGLKRERIRMEGPAEHFDFLRAYDRIDLALDTFPYNGGTTTTEAIWQGVPVVCFNGDRWLSRTSASILRAGNMSDWVADDLDGYIALAVRAATETGAAERLAELRRGMRDHLRSSAVCDSEAFARNMERIYLRTCGGSDQGS